MGRRHPSYRPVVIKTSMTQRSPNRGTVSRASEASIESRSSEAANASPAAASSDSPPRFPPGGIEEPGIVDRQPDMDGDGGQEVEVRSLEFRPSARRYPIEGARRLAGRGHGGGRP